MGRTFCAVCIRELDSLGHGAAEPAEFSRSQLTELDNAGFEAWANESFEIAVKIAYRNGAFRGTPKGDYRDCREVVDAKVLPNGYTRVAGQIADRRIMLAGYQLADLLKRVTANKGKTSLLGRRRQPEK